jgi:phosphoglycolate phosphatase-like HAD superfamily hydrolase
VKDRLSDYQPVRVERRIAYVKQDALNHLNEIEAVIFDCDGVLIDTRRSYNATIIQTARFILKQFAGVSLPQRVITQSVIDTLRKSGGFNNDWNSTYVIGLYLFSCLPQQHLEDFHQGRRQLHHIRDEAASLHKGLSHFAGQADSSGMASLGKILLARKQPQWKVKALRRFKELLGYPEQGAHSLLATIFDEIFYGPDLFRKAHRQRAQHYTGSGAIDNEIPIVTETALKQLAEMVGKRNLGIASGRGTLATRYTLGPLFDYFNPRARILLEDDELNHHDDIDALRAERAKHAPYSLLASARAMKQFKRAMYVGDSAEDFIMTRRANQRDPRYLFVGVTDGSHDPKAKRTMFADAMADVIIPSVNELPALLQALKD